MLFAQELAQVELESGSIGFPARARSPPLSLPIGC
jgi:hypothetical protein